VGAPAEAAADRRSTAVNVVAGISVAGLLVPEAIAYAGIAGLAPQHALVASVAGLLAYACIGSSRYAIVTPTSSSAAILAAAVATLSASGLVATEAVVLTGALVLLVGVLFALAAAARLGHLAAFISRPVLRGFAFGLAVTIVVKQLPHIAGVHATGGGPAQVLLQLGQQLSTWNPWSLGLGAVAYLCLRVFKRVPYLPVAFVVMALGILAAITLDLPAHGVPLVGTIDLAHLHFQWPELGRDAWLRVGELAIPLVVILYAESWGSIRALALRHGDQVDANRELAGLGLANLVSGALQGMPVGAGFSGSSANEDAGASGKAAGLMAAGAIVLLMLAAGRWLALLPQPVLAAVVISALTHALDPRPLIALWRLGRDEVLATCAVLAVIVLGVLHGMMLAVLLSIVAAVRRFSQSRVAVLGDLDGTRDYVEVARHPSAVEHPGVLVVRPEQPLFFANAERALAMVRTLLDTRADVQVVVLSLEESVDLDSTALEALAEFSAWIARSHRSLVLARVKEDVRELLQRTAVDGPATPCYWSVADAVAAASAGISGASVAAE
jgi:MFS superfamily sulfate permease-like transporter